MVTKEQILTAYKLLLNLDVEEDETLIKNLLDSDLSLHQLRSFIINSSSPSELAKCIGLSNSLVPIHPFHLPKLSIDKDVSESNFQKLFDRIKTQWESLGSSEPYWSTITQPQYKSEIFLSNSQEFYDSGYHSAELLFAFMRRNSIDPIKIRNCLEVGCGVGRMTQSLSKHFPMITAIDVSSFHLEIAEKLFTFNKIENTEFIHLNGISDYEKLGNYDLIISLITLQHNPPPLIGYILEKLLSKLNNAGILFIQIPTYINGYIFDLERYFLDLKEDQFEMHCLSQADIFQYFTAADCKILEVREDLMTGGNDKILSNTFFVQKNI